MKKYYLTLSKSNIGLNVVFSLLVLSIIRCGEKPSEFTLGQELISSQTTLSLIDTLSVDLSTVILDSIITSGTGTMLIGCYSDDIFGKITCESYFQIGVPDEFDINDDDVYDSLKLVIKYNKYSFGDTTRYQKIDVHELNEKIEFGTNGNAISTVHFGYNPEPVGSIRYVPRPNGEVDTLAIKLNDDMGIDLFTKMRSDVDLLTNDESFLNYFPGLVLIADDSYEGSIIGFNASEDDVRLILYTSNSMSDDDHNSYEFKMYDTNKQYNQIVHDFSSTQLALIREQRYNLPSKACEGLAFLQGGTGLVIRVDFPSLSEILLRDRGTIVKAELSLAPLANDEINSALPANLYLYQSDKLNRIYALVRNNQGGTVTSLLNVDELYDEYTAYVFDITKYVQDELADSNVDSENGLIISLGYSTAQTRFDRLVLDAQNKNTILGIYYLSY